jgi:CDP-paratose 2-epimerase
MQKIIITGGAGFMGANFANYFLSQGHKVLLFDNLSRKGCLENIAWLQRHEQADNLELLVGDVRCPPRSLAAAVESADALFHFAAQVAVTTSVADPRYDFEVNTQGAFNLLELVRTSQGKRPVIFYASTNKVYGGIEDVAVTEESDHYRYRDLPQGISEEQFLDFHSPYGCSKGCAEQYVRDYARIYDLKTVVFRQSCIYGYRQFGIEDQGWVAWFSIAAALGKALTVYGNGKQVRDILFIEDLILAYTLAWANIDRTAGQIYNVGGGPNNAISLRHLLAFLQREVDADLTPTYAEWRPGDQRIYISNITKCQQDFGWQPEVSWTTGVMKLLDWVQSHREMLERLF